MTHLGTMLHFRLPTSSIITRRPAATDSPPAVSPAISRESERAHGRVESIFDGGASNLMSDVRPSACVYCVVPRPGTVQRRHLSSAQNHQFRLIDNRRATSKHPFCDNVVKQRRAGRQTPRDEADVSPNVYR